MTAATTPPRPASASVPRSGSRSVRRSVRRGAAAVLATTAATALLAGCDGLPQQEDGGTGGGGSDASATPTGTPASGGAGEQTSPLKNPEGTEPGLAALTSDTDKVRARRLINQVRTKGRGPRTGYEREEFGRAWLDTAEGIPLARNGCDTRNDVLKRDGRKVTFRSGSDCVVVSMTLADPYTGKDIAWKKAKATEVQIDHVVPLSYAWQMGAAQWDEEKRKRLANDVLNLLPVSGSPNASKGDSGPASWLPPNKRIRCSYAVRFTQVALEYDLPVTAPDKRMMLQQCEG